MKKLTQAMIGLRKKTPSSHLTNVAKGSEIWPYYKNGESKERVIVFLRGPGCGWVKKTGGCTMCQHAWEGTTQGKSISAIDYIEQFSNEVNKYSFSEKLSGICIFNEGNFFNEEELPLEAREYMISYISNIPRTSAVKDVTFETLPEYIDDKAIESIRKIVARHKDVTIGIGLESANDSVRKIINKPFSLKTYERAVQKIRDAGAKVLAYVLVKPPFLTEREALDDAVNTAQYAFNVGTSIVSFEPINIGDYTIAGLLHKKDLYRAPWWWTVFSVVVKTYQSKIDGEIRIGGAQYKPSYKLVPHNCPVCSDQMLRIIDDWNKNESIEMLGKVLNEYPCVCKNQWSKELDFVDPVSLLDRPDRDL